MSRKITASVARIALGKQDVIELGNLNARRDFGWADDTVDAMVRMIEHRQPDDYVVATGRSHTTREFAASAFAAASMDDWEPLVRANPAFSRPLESGEQRGDPWKAREVLEVEGATA